jgi:hypothetical protein
MVEWKNMRPLFIYPYAIYIYICVYIYKHSQYLLFYLLRRPDLSNKKGKIKDWYRKIVLKEETQTSLRGTNIHPSATPEA